MRKIKYFGVCCTMIILLVGCAKQPDVQSNENGVASAVSNEEQERQEELEENSKEFLVKTENGYECNIVLGEGENQIRIETILENDIQNVNVLTVIPSNEVFDEATICEVFFSGTNDMDLLEEQGIPYNEETKYDGNEDSTSVGVMLKTSVDQYVHYQSMEKSIDFSRPSDSSLYYSHGTLYSEYNGVTDMPDKKVYEKSVSDEYSFEMAWGQLENALEQIGISGLVPDYYIGYEKNEKCMYTVDFQVTLDGIPLAEELSHGYAEAWNVKGYAEICPEGIVNLFMENMLWETEKSETIEILTANQALTCIEQYINNGMINGSGFSGTYERFELMYMLTTSDNEHFVLKPIWRIYEPGAKQVFENEAKGTAPDIVIDATNGELIKVE